MITQSALAVIATLASQCIAAFYYPDIQTSLLEHILVDNWGAYASNFSSAITPCTNYVTQTGDAALKSGRTTAAQWMRVLFHDFITANVSAGTGGVDASIGFETARGENSGSAFNDSFTFWRPFVNEYVPMADLVALGTVMSNNLCGGRLMQYRPGRIDALAADPTTGVPAPETDLEETLTFFERAGFDREDSIRLTACGHTLGSVHHGGFPDVVDEAAVTPNNTNGGVNFDSTRGSFDPLVVQEYLSWTGQRGGPLVTTANLSTQSDLRLYESDNNATMKGLLELGDGFKDVCSTLLGRATNTVPSSVTLKAPVKVMQVKPYNVSFDFDQNGELILTGRVRIISSADSAGPSSISLRISDHKKTLTAEAEGGISVFGKTTYFPFAIPALVARNAKSFSVSDHSFPIQSNIFIVPSRTILSERSLSAIIAVNAGRSCSELSLVVASPHIQLGTLAPKISAFKTSLGASGEVKDYRLCSSALELDHPPTGAVSLRLIHSGQVTDSLIVNDGAAGW